MGIIMRNPFTLGLAKDEDFCDRHREMDDLLRHARNGQKVVLSSPRRFGKSSLVMRVLERLAGENFLTAYVDLFPVSSEEDFLQRLGLALVKGISKGVDPRSLVQKASDIFRNLRPSLEVTPEGYSLSVQFDRNSRKLLLDDLLEGLHAHVKKKKTRACIVLDEFQEITELPESKKIEGILRSHIQSQADISYFFVGSRRRVLSDMFANKRRPFYKTAFFYPLHKISGEDFGFFIRKQFGKMGKNCPPDTAKKIYTAVQGYPYYVQKLAALCWDMTERECAPDTVLKAFQKLLEVETTDFEGVWQGLRPVQKGTLTALALEPTSKPYAQGYLSHHRLSLGGMQKALKVLLSLDLIERTDDNFYRCTDPVMEKWIRQKNSVEIKNENPVFSSTSG